MDQNALKQAALELKRLLDVYSPTDKNVALYASAIESTIAQALAGQITTPMRRAHIPGSYLVNEGYLLEHSDLGDANAKFRTQLAGGYTPEFLEALAAVRSAPSGGSEPS